ncbi:ErfK/YbiS/YcfS/YnhG family protein [Methylobacterium tarhaniae]|uniref:ErfK/YbiS/YcfS/YnhG family protein n=1 Tax=Methylobacterium tarhaniae TaxID=1187852 RepID=A0A0J6TF85_9HYPH|nr:L,D-transpeptidase [Methylobacterium tarhaniae]KMO44358.1 ErfK/YbiS/YcfS/YnhG family protein [Methylobacterium tarhaniae]
MAVRGMVLAGAVAAGLGAGPVLAQGAPGAYGGGFIEFLMTGQDPAAVARPLRPAPVAPDGTILAGRGYRQAGYAAEVYGQAPAYARAAGYAPAGSAGAPYSGARVGYAPVVPGASLHSGDPVPAPAYAPDPFEAPRARAVPMPDPEAQEGIARAIDSRFQRQEVAYDGGQRPGTVVIDTPSRFLYLVQPGGRALRYGIGVGRPGFTWSGMKTVSAKREWPDWTPPAEMLRRRPDLPRHMAGGPANPLGARALYLGSSLYRIHGTNEPHTIGQSVSSGCIRMMNEDVMDLYERVPVGARVMVI